jgi:hypothetical protein
MLAGLDMKLLDTNQGGQEITRARRLFMVLSPSSLPYVSLALSSLLRNAEETLFLTLITDSDEDRKILASLLEQIAASGTTQRHEWAVYSEADIDERAVVQLAAYEHLQAFRRGHPCWRKITDPVLLSGCDQEIIILDPDVYFPNRFRFELTPQTGLLLMWQRPSCLLPPEVVEVAMKAGVALAHHTDIGVAQWRMPVDLEWLNWLVGKLGSPNLPRSMHVESIVWAAIAMKIGGGYLNRRTWLCWHRSQYKRLLRRCGASGSSILKRETFAEIKCFHAGGEAKWWLAEAHKLGYLDRNGSCLALSNPLPFTELTPKNFAHLQRKRRWLRKIGYYSLFPQ